jgi:flagellar hook-associated protein 1 FlgK
MGDMLSNGLSGLLAFQSALDTISNNISNVNTPGYSGENVNLVSGPGQASSSGWIGNGVTVSSVTRDYNDFLAQQTNGVTSSYNQLNTLSTLADSINNMLGSSSAGLSATLQSFSQSIQTLAASPSSSADRQAVISQAQTLISQLQGYQSTLGQLQTQVNTQVASEVSTITSLAQQIASLNQQITTAQNATQQPPNQLLDERDNLISQLSQDVSVNTVTQSNGAINVFIGSGQPLVVGDNASTLTTQPDQFGSGQLQVDLSTPSGNVNITPEISGGTLGGTLQFSQQMLTPAQNTLGQIAVTLSSLVNTQNQAGLDQNGQIGQALMTVGAPTVLPSSDNQGTESVTASITNLGGLTTSNYYLSYNGTSWALVDTASGVAAPLTSSTSGTTTTLTGAGLTLTVSGTAHAGDQFLVQPTAAAVSGMAMLTTDPTAIAAAGPLVTSAGANNSGSGVIQSASVPDLATWTQDDYTVSFTSPSAYTVTNSSGATVASGTYTAGSPIDFDGMDVTITGAPATGDSFAIDANSADSGDNSNALLLANVLNQNVLAGGAQSINDVVNGLVDTVGLQTSQAQNGTTAQQAALTSAQSAQQSVQGVNLDQQAAEMVQYQQAYQAAAEVIATAQSLFNSVLAVFAQTGT